MNFRSSSPTAHRALAPCHALPNGALDELTDAQLEALSTNS
jgi:hypothetical protein